ncbi:DUF6817 domain-containing protein [Oceanicoccus sagamiensis]|uniref:DUF6817 domain-containing protein n=1 Tax=Oceanicoccus sagamiensis TaxID=716816 RepID=A0A1X9NGM5_9GAMM|nr:hypothetical protein [Oceanicoccus sagamiensis]ARN76321.1 hypothetical protein BST96_06335 [Oceanicoccus sagamiensis]
MTYSSINVKDKFLALKALGVGEFEHLNGNLETHLYETYQLLVNWGNPDFVCDAGLYHAVYGTQAMKDLGIPCKEFSPSDRPNIRKIIGNNAENLVYLYGACDRDYFYPQIGSPNPIYRDRFDQSEKRLPGSTMQNILEITMANELQLCISSSSFRNDNRDWFIALFDRFEGIVSNNAFRLYRDLFTA